MLKGRVRVFANCKWSLILKCSVFVGSEGLGFFMYHAGCATPRISWSFCMGASLSLPFFGHQASHHALLCNHARDGALATNISPSKVYLMMFLFHKNRGFWDQEHCGFFSLKMEVGFFCV